MLTLKKLQGMHGLLCLQSKQPQAVVLSALVALLNAVWYIAHAVTLRTVKSRPYAAGEYGKFDQVMSRKAGRPCRGGFG